jgi:hypothetical protein
VQLAGRFDPRVATADHDKRQQPGPHRRVVDQIGLLEAVDERGAESERVGDRLHRPAILRHSGYLGEVGDMAEGYNQVLVADHLVPREAAAVDGEFLASGVDGVDASLQYRDAPAELPQGVDDILR